MPQLLECYKRNSKPNNENDNKPISPQVAVSAPKCLPSKTVPSSRIKNDFLNTSNSLISLSMSLLTMALRYVLSSLHFTLLHGHFSKLVKNAAFQKLKKSTLKTCCSIGHEAHAFAFGIFTNRKRNAKLSAYKS